MVLVTSLLTGLFAAMLRSVVAVISVAFLIAVTFIAAFALHGASVIALAICIAGFNGGLVLFALAHLLPKGARSA